MNLIWFLTQNLWPLKCIMEGDETSSPAKGAPYRVTVFQYVPFSFCSPPLLQVALIFIDQLVGAFHRFMRTQPVSRRIKAIIE